MAMDSTASVRPDRVTFTRRFFGDYLLEAVLAVCTLGIGWLIWLAIVAPKGQTPAKKILNVYIIDHATGEVATAGKVWLRDFVAKLLIPSAISIVLLLATQSQNGSNLGNLYTLAGAIMILASSDNRAIWDQIAGTRVVYRPGGPNQMMATQVMATQVGFDAGPRPVAERLEALDAMRAAGTITEAEYMDKRRDILASL